MVTNEHKIDIDQFDSVAVDVDFKQGINGPNKSTFLYRILKWSVSKTKELENSNNTMDQLVTLQSKLRADCDKIEKLEMKIKNEIITLTKARVIYS